MEKTKGKLNKGLLRMWFPELDENQVLEVESAFEKISLILGNFDKDSEVAFLHVCYLLLDPMIDRENEKYLDVKSYITKARLEIEDSLSEVSDASKFDEPERHDAWFKSFGIDDSEAVLDGDGLFQTGEFVVDNDNEIIPFGNGRFGHDESEEDDLRMPLLKEKEGDY